ncbi:unnamed protein product [Moneuplotes crassus]|uniref:Protein kinase domain-containing protein n=1 Tax=Euplotes crassus TaxID=5936 RepID=A0AAD1UUK7_EUPCR|nr:unnamed protein product [Moneuplotes crassus]
MGRTLLSSCLKPPQRKVNKNLKEAKLLCSFSHKNIVRFLECGIDVELKQEHMNKNVSFIATELAEKGSLFDYIKASQGLNERLARTLSVQIVEAIEFLHSKGISHRDIKPENIFLTQKFECKVGDFGFATQNITDDTYCGSSCYMAPEIYKKKRYNCQATDIFSLGVFFFFMVTGKYPFACADVTDSKFKAILTGKTSLFWRTALGSKKRLSQLSPEFIELVTLCLSPDPVHRPTISEIYTHAWFKTAAEEYSSSDNGTVYSDEISSELLNIESEIDDISDTFISFH